MYLRASLVVLLLGLSPLSLVNAQRTVSWIGGADVWDDNGHWIDDQTPPQNLQPFTSDTAVIASGVPLCNSLENVFELSVGAGAGINIPGPGTLNVNSGNATNNGTIMIGSGTGGQLILGPGTLDGAGEDSADYNGFFDRFVRHGGSACIALGLVVATHAIRHFLLHHLGR